MKGRGETSVDVIVTGHNYARWIGEAIASVFAQTRRDYTLTVVDDGSTDETPRVVEACLRNAPEGVSCTLVRTRDVGPSLARHAAIRRTRSPYLLCLDADDLIAPTALERHVPQLDRHARAGFSYSDRQLFGEITHLYREPDFDLQTLAHHNFVGGGVLVRRTAYDEVGGYRRDNWGYAEDWDLWLDIAEAGWTGRHVAEPLFLYRHHMSTSLSFFVTRFLPAYLALLRVHHPRLYSTDQVRRARTVLRGMPRGWNRRAPYRTVEDCRQALAANPGNPHLLFLLAMIHLRRGEVRLAVRRLEELNRRDPADQQGLQALAVLRSVTGTSTVVLAGERLSIQDAVCRVLQMYGHGIRVESIPPAVVVELGRIWPRSFALDTLTIRCWEEQVARRRRRLAAGVLTGAGVFETLAAGAHAEELRFVHNVASACRTDGARDRAREIFTRLLGLLRVAGRQSIEHDDQIGACCFHLGELAFDQRRFEEAHDWFTECVRYTPDHRRAALYLARLRKVRR